MTYDSKCLIWNTLVKGMHVKGVDQAYSPRTGGWYQSSIDCRSDFSGDGLDDGHKARLTTWLVEQRLLGNDPPLITKEIIEETKRAKGMRASERADHVLQFLAERTQILGTSVDMICVDERSNDNKTQNLDPKIKAYLELLAHSESIGLKDLFFLLDHLKYKGLIEGQYFPGRGNSDLSLTVPGYERVAELEQVENVASDQVFVAMCFDALLDEVWSKGIKPAVEAAGYKAVRVDEEHFTGDITDKIISEIRRSRFVVADFSHGKKGASEGVYYEAGFACGLGLEVISTCKDSDLKKLHFDTRQRNHIKWENSEDLQGRLKERIGAVIGDGPLR